MIAVLIQIADGVLTYFGIGRGLATEGNPLLARLMERYGTFGALLVTKFATVTLTVTLPYLKGGEDWLYIVIAAYLTLSIIPWFLLFLGART